MIPNRTMRNGAESRSSGDCAGPPGKKDCKEIVIVGGGVSGLAAASHLCRNGMCNITILEAGDRLGGRLRSDRFQGALIQRGAQFIHGEINNPVYDALIKDFKLEKSSYLVPEAVSYKRISGQPISEESIRKYVVASKKVSEQLVLNLTEEKAKFHKYENIRDKGTTLWGAEMQNTLHGVDRNVSKAMLQHLLSYWSDYDGELPEKVGILNSLYYKNLGRDYILADEDYADAFLGVLTKNIPGSSIQLHKRVIRIDWNLVASKKDSYSFEEDESETAGTNKVRVLFSDVNTGIEGKVLADHVIVTVSVGVLQKYHTTMFNPKFTEEKSRALQTLRIGVVNKVFLHFKQRFWNHKVMHILWDSNLSNEFGDDAAWYRHIYVIEGHENETLLVWLNSYATQATFRFTKDEIGRKLTILLRKVFCNDSIPLPDDVLVTAWHEDENFLGSYSYIPVGETLENKTIVAAPLSVGGVPKVLFAGEAMHHSRFSTVDGAYRSGIDEAERILDSVANQLSPSNHLL